MFTTFVIDIFEQQLNMKIKVGIFFGGPSRKREQSFAGGRMIYDHLDKALFEPVPIWVTSRLDFVLLDWSFLYKDDIRHFFPPLEGLPSSPNGFQVYGESLGDLSEEDWALYLGQIGRRLFPSELPQWISMAFLTIPGRFGADGQVQQILAEQQIPFTGSGVDTSRLLFSKAAQKSLLADRNIPTPRWMKIQRETWAAGDPAAYYEKAVEMPGFPLLVRPAHQDFPSGSALVDDEAGPDAFGESIDGAFFRERIPVAHWREAGSYDKLDHLQLLTDPKDALGFPIDVTSAGERVTIHHPEQLLKYLEERAAAEVDPEATFLLESRYGESEVLLEEYIDGLPFSCIVVRREDGAAVALMPSGRPYDTELLEHPHRSEEGSLLRSVSSLPAHQLESIRRQSEAAFEQLGIQAYGRLEGYLTETGRILISEASLVPDLRPGALLFQQMALLGLTPTQALTFLLRTSLQERFREWPQVATLPTLCELLDEKIAGTQAGTFRRRKVAVLMGGGTSNRSLPLEYGRDVFERLSGSAVYEPLPFYLAGPATDAPLFQLPAHYLRHEHSEALQQALDKETATSGAIVALREELKALIDKYAPRDRIYEPHQIALHDLSEWVDSVWIAVCGRPASTGALQDKLENLGIPFNGSRRPALRVAHDRYHSLDILGKNGLSVPDQYLLHKADFLADPETYYEEIESKLGYPLQAMPIDEHHPAATRTLDDRSQLQAYCRLLFREEGHEGLENRYLLKLRPHHDFPRKEKAHFQARMRPEGAVQFLKIQGGALTQLDSEQNIRYELFTPSEIIADRSALTQEEKYLVGRGGCITPARFAVHPEKLRPVKRQVKQTLEKAVRILQLEGLSSLKGYVRVWGDGQVETIISDVQALPVLPVEHCLKQQAVHQGYTPVQLLEQQLQYGEERIKETAAAATGDPLDATEPQTVSAEGSPAESDSPHSEAMGLGISRTDGKATVSEWMKNIFESIWAFLKSPFFLKNLAALLGFLLLLFLLLNFLLNRFTHHGESLQVHNYVGMKIDEAIDKARSRSFKIVVSDSVFLVDREPNVVLEQTPPPFSRVKENRRIYVTVTSSTAPKVLLPPLEGSYNYNAYRRKLLRLGLKPTIRNRQFNNKLEENTILYFYHDGERITEERLRQGVKVPKGSTLDFVVTERLAEEVAAPDLICMRFEEASWVITNYELVVGEIIGSVTNRDNAFVYRQEPAPGQMLQKGSQVNVYLTASRPSNCGSSNDDEAIREDLQEEE
jgi:UDP-N-acetylmuramate--alanine ligase